MVTITGISLRNFSAPLRLTAQQTAGLITLKTNRIYEGPYYVRSSNISLAYLTLSISCEYVSNSTTFGKGGRETSGKNVLLTGVLVICVLVFTVFCIVSFMYIYFYLLLV